MSTQHLHLSDARKSFSLKFKVCCKICFFCLSSTACMVRRRWTQIEVPEGWTQIIRGRRPQAVKWPPADRRRQDSSKPNHPSATSPKGPSRPDVKSTSTPESKVGRLEAALKVREEEQSESRTALEEALRTAKEEGDRMAAASAPVTQLKAALQLLGEDTHDAAPLKVALEQARGQASLRPVGERVDSCLQFIERVKKQIGRPTPFNGPRSSVGDGGGRGCSPSLAAGLLRTLWWRSRRCHTLSRALTGPCPILLTSSGRSERPSCAGCVATPVRDSFYV